MKELYANWKATLIASFKERHTDPVTLDMAIGAIKSFPDFVKTCRNNPDFHEFVKSLPKI
jgi:hypothetical protein